MWNTTEHNANKNATEQNHETAGHTMPAPTASNSRRYMMTQVADDSHSVVRNEQTKAIFLNDLFVYWIRG